jgi:hypothetical protein
VGVVAVVLVDPPAVTQPDAEVGVQHADEIVGFPGAEDLAMTRVVADETDLREQHREERGSEHLPPRLADHNERGPRTRKQHDDGGDAGSVETAASLE